MLNYHLFPPLPNPTVPKPTVVISANPSGGLSVDSSLTLICTTTFQSQVDVQSISIMWGGPRVVNGSGEPYSVMETDVGLKYTSNLTISHVMKSDEGEYTCTVLVYEGTDVISDSIQVNVLGECICNQYCMVITLLL